MLAKERCGTLENICGTALPGLCCVHLMDHFLFKAHFAPKVAFLWQRLPFPEHCLVVTEKM